MEFKDLFVIFMIIGIFVFALISLAYNFTSENNTSTQLQDEPIMNRLFGNLSKELNDSTTKTNQAKELLEEEEKHPILSQVGFVFNSLLQAGQLFTGSIINIFGFIISFMYEIVAGNPAIMIILSSIMAILVGLIVLAIWSVVRSGR